MDTSFNIKSGPSVLSVLQWNVLAQRYSTQESFPAALSQHLLFSQRLPKIIKTIRALSPTIMALQEVDRIQLFKQQFQRDYHIFYQTKKKHGILLAVRRENLVSSPTFQALPLHQNNLMAHAFIDNGLKQMHVFAVHLTAKEGKQSVRLIEVDALLREIQKIPKQQNILLLGDFNAQPHYQSIKKILTSKLNLISVFPLEMKTTYKLRAKDEYRTIDYQFVRGLQPLCYRACPHKQQLGARGLPNEQFPSDHLYLWCLCI